MTGKTYAYVGPPHLLAVLSDPPPRAEISRAKDLADWAAQAARYESLPDGTVPATYVIDPEQRLWLADRRSEHVACARGGPVLMAGELFCRLVPGGCFVETASNLSTGYCPAPEYAVLAAVLDRLQVSHPGAFEPACEFRHCACGQINVIKDGDLVCAVCGQQL